MSNVWENRLRSRKNAHNNKEEEVDAEKAAKSKEERVEVDETPSPPQQLHPPASNVVVVNVNETKSSQSCWPNWIIGVTLITLLLWIYLMSDFVGLIKEKMF